MSTNNSVTLIGHLGDAPQVHSTQDGREFVTFSLATNRTWKDKNTGEKQTRTEWHNCVQYGARAQVVKNYLKKGSEVAVSGELRYNSYTKNDITIKTAVIVVNDFHFIGKKSDNTNNIPQNPLVANKPQANPTAPQQTAPAQTATAAATTVMQPVPSFTGVDADLAAALGDNNFANSIESDIPF